ncbi:unnamed protein product [Rotaria sordida]|uniref:Bromo domain-containing protein n=1 Tax=Rotaria sordida TaxID=392033 RepID=A0A818UNR7_9BILA|nr:unnamed protein product [Rotaria sordida]
MTTHKWDMKSNYMLTFTVCKYGLNPEQWDIIANDLAEDINITPQNCKAQFYLLCQQYGQDWHKESLERLDIHIFSIIKRLYYGDLCERMTESRDLLMVMYDFIRLFKSGRIQPNDINEILQDIKNSATTYNSTQDNERDQKIKMLGRLKLHMTRQISQTSDSQSSSYPVELLPPPPFFQYQPIVTNYISQKQSVVTTDENDRQVPSIDNHKKSDQIEISSFPIITQSNNIFIENKIQPSNNNNNDDNNNNNNQSNEDDIDEIELSSNDDNDRTETIQMSNIDESVASRNLITDQDESTFMSVEHVETNESSTIPPMPIEVSNSNDKDLYDIVSSTGISNQSTSDTRLSAEDRATSSINELLTPSNLQFNTNTTSSSDYSTLDNDRIELTEVQNHHPIETESIVTISRHISVDDNEINQMDTEHIPDDNTDVIVLNNNDNASFIVDEAVSNIDTSKISISSKTNENDESTMTGSSNRKSRLTTNSLSHNFRKSIISILNNLKTAKYGSDFAKPLKSFKLPNEYYYRIKKPLDIPEIRERMYNGDYDDNFLLFERDILLMFTNALSMYHRDLDIHDHAQYMINYAMELFSPIENIRTPWKTDQNKNDDDDDDSSNLDHPNNENDSNDNTLNNSSSIQTSLISSMKNLRRQTTSNHPMNKRQRKTIQ